MPSREPGNIIAGQSVSPEAANANAAYNSAKASSAAYNAYQNAIAKRIQDAKHENPNTFNGPSYLNDAKLVCLSLH